MKSVDYRNDELFLRNNLFMTGAFDMPFVYAQNISLNDIKLVAFSNTKANESSLEQKAKTVHFFLDDYKFDEVWNNPAGQLRDRKITEDVREFISESGLRFRYDVKNNDFLIYKENGEIVTMYKPEKGLGYWERQVKNMDQKNKSCSCCGFLTLPSDSLFEICPICGWQDDPVQNDDPDYAGGANMQSLNEYQAKWLADHKRVKRKQSVA
jgi:hypothetical protein